MRRLASGGVQPNLNLGLVRTLRIPVPPRDDRQRIVAEVGRRLSIVREGEAEVDVNLKRAQALRQAVLSTHFQAHSRRGS
jgi:type I restriction enzyme, S subunit